MKNDTTYAVITENDDSGWEDDTGVLYHFPNRYLKYLQPGTEVIYLQGKMLNKKYSFKRLSHLPHYFGKARVGKIFPDNQSSKGDKFAVLENYEQFKEAVLAKENGEYFEHIPQNRKTNYWRDGVRELNKHTYTSILSKTKRHAIFADYLRSQLNDGSFEFDSFKEGGTNKKFVTTYERDARLRRLAIAIHGSVCEACGFDFGIFYGEYAEGFIHIHHITPISELDGAEKVDPEKELIPLCANCHSVIHRRKDNTLSIDELKSMIKIAAERSA